MAIFAMAELAPVATLPMAPRAAPDDPEAPANLDIESRPIAALRSMDDCIADCSAAVNPTLDAAVNLD